MSYVRYRLDRLTPPWLLDAVGAAWQRVLGEAQDALIEAAKAAALAGYPEHAPADALPVIGDERRIERGPGESEDSYRERLRTSFEAWVWSGTKRGLLAAFHAAGFPLVETITNREWDPAPPDGDVDRWARFWLVIGQPHGMQPLAWDDGWDWDDTGLTYDSTATPEDIERLKRLIRTWQPGHARCAGLVLNFDSSRTGIHDEITAVAALGLLPLTTDERITVLEIDAPALVATL